jgi:hypothetical protein
VIAVPVRCLRCGGWTLRSPRPMRTPRRYAPRWMRYVPAITMAGGIQIGASGVTIGSGGVIVTDADGTPCCCVSSSSGSSSSGSQSAGSGSSSSSAPPFDCSAGCAGSATTISFTMSLTGNCSTSCTLTRAGTNCEWSGTTPTASPPNLCSGVAVVISCTMGADGHWHWGFATPTSGGTYGFCTDTRVATSAPQVDCNTTGGSFSFHVTAG